MKHIVLTGYMASGKTTVGKGLLRKIHPSFQWIDLDQHIEELLDQSIPEIFAQKGEAFFREIESAELRNLLALTDPILLSTGGGAASSNSNMEIINANAYSVFLEVPISMMIARIQNTNQTRPLASELNTEFGRKKFIDRYESRLPFYKQAQITVNAAKKKEAIEEILAKLPEDIINF